MKKKILVGSIFVLAMILLMPSIPAIQQKTIEDKIYSDFVFYRYVFRYYLIGDIYNLTIDGDDYDFQYTNLWGLKIFRSWGSSGFRFEISFFHGKNVYGYMGFDGFEFSGIIESDFICGCFHSSSFNWWIE